MDKVVTERYPMSQQKSDYGCKKVSIGTRLRSVREYLGLSQPAFAAKLETHKITVGRYERGNRIPKSESLEAIIRLVPDLNTDWLLTGRGEMLVGAAQDATDGSNQGRAGGGGDTGIKSLGDTIKRLLDKIDDLEGREGPTIAVPMDPEFWNALMRLPQEHFDAMKAATLSVAQEHGLSEPDEFRPVLHVNIQSAKGRQK